MSTGGFTEKDQARIADEVQARVRSKRVGLGFGGANADGITVPSSFSTRSSSQSSAWFQQAQNAAQIEVPPVERDTTEGAFPWDVGDRRNPEGAGRRGDFGGGKQMHGRSKGFAQENRTLEREFPLVRERDIDDNNAGRDRRGSRSRSRKQEEKTKRRTDRSRSRSRTRSRASSGSGERDRYCKEREKERKGIAQYERERERRARDRQQLRGQRSSSRDRGFIDRAGNHRHSGRESQERDAASRKGKARYSTEHSPARKTQKKATPTAEQAKATLKRRLKEAVSGDVTLKTGFKASLGGGGGWERSEMADAADFFKDDEVAAKGAVASVAPEYAARIAAIRAIEDEEIMCLGDGARQVSTIDPVTDGLTNSDSSMQKHHDAIFAPTDSVSQGGETDADQPPTTATKEADVHAKPLMRAAGSSGVIGAAARARLALTGKVGPPIKDADRSKATTARAMSDEALPAEGQAEQPLFKILQENTFSACLNEASSINIWPRPERIRLTLKAGDTVEARYTADDKWYSAIIAQVIHGGYEIARYKVRYPEYGNEETISWTRIKRIYSVQTPPPPPALHGAAMPSTQPPSAYTTPPGAIVKTEEAKPVAFAGLRPRSVAVDQTKSCPRLTEQPKQALTSEASKKVVNPSLLAMNQGKKLSWKEKLQARRAETVGPGADGLSIAAKTVSLVPDFAAQRREQDVDKRLDKSEWRAKVVFGLGGSKDSNRS